MALRNPNQALLLKVESTEGVDSVPTPGSDAILLDDLPQLSFNAQITEGSEVNASLDPGEFDLGALPVQLTVPLSMKGSGTGGVAPQAGLPLRLCSMKEVLQAGPIPSAGTSVADAGTSTSFDIDTGVETDWPTTDGALDGMPVTLSVNPVTPVTTVILRYTVVGGTATVEVAHTFATPLDGTTEAVVEPNATYIPFSGVVPSATAYRYRDGVLTRVGGFRGNAALQLTAGQKGRLNVTLQGIFFEEVDAAVPSLTLESTRPPPWRDGVALVNRLAVGMNQFTLDLQNNLATPPNPNTISGVDPVIVTARNIQGSVDPNTRLVATAPVMDQFRNGTAVPILAMAGSTSGNRWAVAVRRAKYRDKGDAERNGVAVDNLPFSPLGVDGETFMTFF